MKIFKSKNSLIAALSILLIGSHLFLHATHKASGILENGALYLVFLIGVGPLLWKLFLALKRREFGTDLLAGLSVVIALILGENLAGSIIVVMFFGGSALEDFAVKNASSVLEALSKRIPTVAHLRGGAEQKDIRVDEIKVDDLLEIFPHEVCPVDGIVTEGHGAMNEAYLTGEPFQVDKAPGTSVISGAINGETPLTIRTLKIAADSRYAKITQVMRDTERNKPRMRRLAERLAAWYTPVSIAIAVAAWLVSRDPSRFLSVLVVATPCPLLIGIPVAVLGSISLCAKRAIIVKRPSALEEIEECRVAIFDKTGTLTYGEPVFADMDLKPGHSENDVLVLAASVERYSKHPLAGAVIKEARKRNLMLSEALQIRVIAGRGLQGSVGGREVEITNRKNLKEDEARALPPSAGSLECVVLVDGHVAAALRFHDAPRSEGNSFIRHLGPRHHFERTMIVSGDRESEVRYLASKVGVTEIFAEKTPEEKLKIVKNETRKAKTLYVGDGINDAPALMIATVGIAIGKNSDVASEAASVVVMDNSLAKVDEFMHIGRRFRKIALQSAVGGMALSFLGMAAAASGHLTPGAGALFQEGIDLLAIFNALRCAFLFRELSDF